MSTITDWNTNFIYGEDLTSPNMNSSTVGYLCPGVYNADMYFEVGNTTSDTGWLYFTISKGTTIVFSHTKDDNGNMNNKSYEYCTKCIAVKDAKYILYNQSTDSTEDTLKSILNSDIFFIYAMKKIVSTDDFTDAMPIIGLLSFVYTTDGKIDRKEYTIPNSNISTEYVAESTKSYYQILGAIIKTNYDSSSTGLYDNGVHKEWLTYHTFTTRVLPAYNSQKTYTNDIKHNDIFYYTHDNKLYFDVNFDETVINNIIYDKTTDWKNIYGWCDGEDINSNSLCTNDASMSGRNNIKPSLLGTSKSLRSLLSTTDNTTVAIDFIYSVTESEKCGNIDLSNILFNENEIKLNLSTFYVNGINGTDESVLNIIKNRNLFFIKTLDDDSDDTLFSYLIEDDYTQTYRLYSDTSVTSINRLLSIIKNKNIIPTLCNAVRYNSGTVLDIEGTTLTAADVIVPIALSFRIKNGNEEFYNVNVSSIDPNNTLCFFDLQTGNKVINTNLFTFQMADVLSALSDDTYI